MMYEAVDKRFTLMEGDMSRFAVRAVLGGAYLTLGTGFSLAAGQAVEQAAPGAGLGALVFACFFGLGLFAIILLNTELATGNMMFGSYGATTGQLTWSRALRLMLVTTVFNLMGAVAIALIIGVSGKFDGFDTTHLAATLTEGKLDKTWWGTFLEAVAANFVVNMAILGALYARDIVSKFVIIMSIIAIFVGLGLEHVVANFSLMSITAASGLFNGAVYPENFTVGAVLVNWAIVWVGNVVGGGLLLGSVYAWLNKGDGIYRD